MQYPRPRVDPEQKESPCSGKQGQTHQTQQGIGKPVTLFYPADRRRRNSKGQDRGDSYRYQGKPGGSELLEAVREKIEAAREGKQ